MQSNHVVKACCLGLAIALAGDNLAMAKSPWQWVTFRRTDTDEDASVQLTDKHGPWLIFTASFRR